jgi:hypothetical protein
MVSQLKPAILILFFMTIITGLIYPVTVTGIAQLVFPNQANASLIVTDGKIIGSSLIGQPFDAPKYFWGRPPRLRHIHITRRRRPVRIWDRQTLHSWKRSKRASKPCTMQIQATLRQFRSIS